ncbi:DUF1236 domain-containing protein [Pseudaminobacter salicylatoxidans]|uniref:DUF1236 domain-containing protein n=1 Tax=Pseudaminobacter salicylatoxidans TaxID=93369 RepID=UPI00047446EC|nr:DUF1236 domain-containing protein [Pseudaminobacter salicylatoxidans]
MKPRILSVVAGVMLLGGTGIAAAQDVVVTPEQQTVIREYVQKKPLASISLLGVELNVGSPLPDTVELHEIPDVQYRYVVVNDHTVVVDPATRRIVAVIN